MSRAILLLLVLGQTDPLEEALARVRPRPEEERWRLIPFLPSLQKAFEAASRENKPVFLFGYDGVLDTGNC